MNQEERAEKLKELQAIKAAYRAFFKTPGGEHLLTWVTEAEQSSIDRARRSYEPQEASAYLQRANGAGDVKDHIASLTKDS